jgi:hypothetical protein
LRRQHLLACTDDRVLLCGLPPRQRPPVYTGSGLQCVAANVRSLYDIRNPLPTVLQTTFEDVLEEWLDVIDFE